jgi:hypothetical protein
VLKSKTQQLKNEIKDARNCTQSYSSMTLRTHKDKGEVVFFSVSTSFMFFRDIFLAAYFKTNHKVLERFYWNRKKFPAHAGTSSCRKENEQNIP